MTVEQSLAATAAPQAAGTSEPFSVTWWEGRTAEQLRDIIKRGFAGGQVFQDAVAEAERRAREETTRLRAIAAIEAVSRKRRKWIVGGAVAASVLAVTIVILIAT